MFTKTEKNCLSLGLCFLWVAFEKVDLCSGGALVVDRPIVQQLCAGIKGLNVSEMDV